MSSYCINCGSELQPSWNACPNCGKPLKEKKVPQPQLQQQIQPQRQPQSAPQPYQIQPSQKAYSSGGGNIYGTVAVICGVIGLIGAFFYFGIVLGIVAIVMGGIGLNRDDNNAMAVIGMILGIIDFVCFIVFIFWIITLFAWFPFGGFW